MATDQKDAKQGRTGRPVLMVLIGGLILAGLAAIALDIFDNEAVDSNIGSQDTQTQSGSTQQ